MSKQTSIEWLIEQYEKAFTLKVNTVMTSIIEQAQQMHKEEIVKAFDEGYDLRDTDGTLLYHDGASTRYYQETYGSSPKTSDN